MLRKALKKIGYCKQSIESYPLRVIVTGIEHSGTTLLSKLIKQDSSIASGFECGFLLAKKPRDFKTVHPWYDWMLEPLEEEKWGVDETDMEKICAARNWESAYRRLIKYSPVFDNKDFQQVCDKTPRYLCSLDSILNKVPDFVPCLIIEKDIENLWCSHKRRNSSLEHFIEVYQNYNKGLHRALRDHEGRILRIQYRSLCTDLNCELRKIFQFINLPFKQEYVKNFEKSIQYYYSKMKDEVKEISESEKISLRKLHKI